MRSFRISTMVFAALALVMSTAGATNIKIIREGGGSNGYGYVREFHGTDAEGGHVLACRDAGTQACAWRNKPEMRLIPYAEQQIAGGVLSGSYGMVENGIAYHIAWTATDLNNCTIEETQTPSN